MPLNNRYVVGAFDKKGERLAFLSRDDEWVVSVREAICFPAQTDANHFIGKKQLNERTNEGTNEGTSTHAAKLASFDHAQPVFVTVTENHTEFTKTKQPNPEDTVCFAGIYG